MKRLLLLAVFAGIGAAALPVHSQAPAAPAAATVVVIAGSPLEKLRAIRDQNAKLLDQQATTLKKLEDLDKAAQQLKIFGRRS